MPITSRLSRRLYETFGDEAAADLVDWMHHVDAQRTEMRELNELNFARFEARLAQFETRLEQRIGALDTRIEQRIGALDTKVEQKAAELMKWSLVFWVGAVGAIAALAGVLG